MDTSLFDAFDVADLGTSLQALFREPQYVQAKGTVAVVRKQPIVRLYLSRPSLRTNNPQRSKYLNIIRIYGQDLLRGSRGPAYVLAFRFEDFLWDLILDPDQTVLMVGEAPRRSCAIALSAMRGTWRGLSASGLSAPSWEREDLIGAIAKARCRARINFETLATVYDRHLSGLDSALEHLRLLLIPLLFPSSQIHLRLLYTIDATFLDSEPLPQHEIIYFQSPWAGSGRQYDLLTETIESASRLKTGARFLVFGITEHESYHEQYRFNEVIAFAALVGYHHLGKTNELAYGSRDGTRPGLLAHGYKHESAGKVIHKDILNEHVAHVFKIS
ncbi:hypothetical protein JCM21900_005321 [Sporobolomyces salmonicolor]